MAIISVVVSAIWLAASTVQENLRRSDAVKAISVMAPKLALLARDENPAVATQVNSLVINLGIPPSNWIKGGAIFDPWGHVMTFFVNSGRGGMHFQNVEQGACIEILSRLSGSLKRAQEVYSASVYNGATSTGYTWPNLPTAITCPDTASGLLIMIYFKTP